MIEINRRGSDWLYRINPANPRQIDHKPNRHNARWTTYMLRDSAKEAKAALLQLRGPDDAKGDTP